MCDWNTHLYCAHKVNQRLKFEGQELDMFMFGNLLPDVNMGWIIAPEVRLEQCYTHFDGMGQEYFWAPQRFYEKYKEAIDSRDPLHLGYLFHLWMDVANMTYFVNKIPMSQMISDYHKVRELKWKDTSIFIRNHKFTLSDNNVNSIVSHAKAIDEVNISKSDLLKVVDYINEGTREFEADSYQLYSEKELEDFYERNCSDFISWLAKI